MNRNHGRNHLPPEASLIDPPEEKRLGSYVPMLYDAVAQRHGVTWYRVHKGMGGRGDREDWVADLEERTASVHDYHWNGEDFGPNYGTFDNACLQELRLTLRYAKEELEKVQRRALSLQRTTDLLGASVDTSD